jgi:hypothetical protein
MTTLLRRLSRFDRILLAALSLYSLAVAPIEIAWAASTEEQAAAICAKLLWILLVVGTYRENRTSTWILSFLCLVSSIVMSLNIPATLSTYPTVAGLIIFDVFLKASIFYRLAIAGRHRSATPDVPTSVPENTLHYADSALEE